jgi:hypothetical protein
MTQTPDHTPEPQATPGEGTRQERCTLTDAEREAIEMAYSRLTSDANYEAVAATLRGLLSRTA